MERYGYADNRDHPLPLVNCREGHVRGIARTIEGDRSCMDLINQPRHIDSHLDVQKEDA